MTPTQSDEDKCYEEFWKPILGDLDSIDKEQLKKELYDYKCMIRNWSVALCELTNGKLSKPNYTSSVIIDAVNQAFEDSSEQELEAVKREYFEKGKRDLVGALEELSLEQLKSLKSKQAQGGE